MIQVLIKLYTRDLETLKHEIDAYEDEGTLWKINGNIKNSAGNLCLHLMGNLNNYIGADLGKTGYIRNRPLEFSAKNVPKKVLIEKIDATILMIQTVLPTLSAEVLVQKHTAEFEEGKNSNEYFLIHLHGHLNYHLGQINYHRRLIDK